MRTQKIYYNHRTENFCGAHLLRLHTNTNSEALKHKSDMLKKLIREDLTDRQQLCATEYWINGRKQKEIAALLGLSCSTVSRHIAAAKRKLCGVAKYLE